MNKYVAWFITGLVVGASVSYWVADWQQDRKAVKTAALVTEATQVHERDAEDIINKSEVVHVEKQDTINQWRDRYDRGVIKLRQCEARAAVAGDDQSPSVGAEQGAEQRDVEPSPGRIIFAIADDHNTLESQRDYWRDQYDLLWGNYKLINEVCNGKP